MRYLRFYGLLDKMPGIDKDELKRTLVRQYTDGRTESLRGMYDWEYDAMCDDLQRRIRQSEPAAVVERRKWRSAVLHQLQLFGVNTADWCAVDAFCLDRRIAGKKFRELTIEELMALMPKLRAIVKKKSHPNPPRGRAQKLDVETVVVDITGYRDDVITN